MGRVQTVVVDTADAVDSLPDDNEAEVRELVVARCYIIFEVGAGNARRELLKAELNISRCLNDSRPESELVKLMSDLEGGMKDLLLTSAAAISNP